MVTLNELKLTIFRLDDVTSTTMLSHEQRPQGKYLDFRKILVHVVVHQSIAAPALNHAATSARSSSVMPVALFMGICRVTTVCWYTV